jgi:ParB/RepB/Spo0J family partition protein
MTDTSKDLRKQYQPQISMLASTEGHCADLPVDLVAVNRNIRQEVRLDEEFLESIRTQGVLQPILVSVLDDKAKRQVVVCVAGHRRLAAAKEVGLPLIKCMSKTLSGRAAIVAALSENVNRAALHPLDLADAFQELAFQGASRSEMEAMFNRDRKTIGRYLKMSKWTAETKVLIRKHSEFFNSRLLLALASKRMTPHEIEGVVRDLIHGKPKPRKPRRPSKKALASALEDFFMSRGLSEGEKGLIVEALRHLNLLEEKTDS